MQVNYDSKSSGIPLAHAVPIGAPNELPHEFSRQPSAPIQSTTTTDYSDARQFMAANCWPRGMQDCLLSSIAKFPIRFMIVDDSGSMITNDGHKLMNGKHGPVSVQCSRWAELTSALKFHAELADRAKAPTEFRLLNGAPPILVGGTNCTPDSLAILNGIFDQPPGGGTPLCKHIREVIAQIQSMAPALHASGQKAVVVIATDGESSDGNIADAMRPLQSLPVWVVVRLCTDDDKVVDYWNNIDAQLELEMDVLDDLFGEAAEVTSANPWLVYGEPMHRLREFGVHLKEFDLIDEAKLSPDEMRVVCSIVLSIDIQRSELPHAVLDWDGFYRAISQAYQSEIQVWDPLTKKTRPWISLTNLKKGYKVGGGCAIM